jgi:hypothetical protein
MEQQVGSPVDTFGLIDNQKAAKKLAECWESSRNKHYHFESIAD